MAEINLANQQRERKQMQSQMIFKSNLFHCQVTYDPIIEYVLNDTEISGRKGMAKIELIEKLQAVFRGAIVRRRMKLMRCILQL